jgi:hypothetical protein
MQHPGKAGGWSPEVFYRFAGGRRRHNFERKNVKWARRAQIIARLVGWPRPLPYGTQAALARALGVSPATISRDMEAIRNADRGALLK